MAYSTLEWCAGWNRAVYELTHYGLDQAHVITSCPHDIAYNAYISGKRACAKLAISSDQIPLKSSFV